MTTRTLAAALLAVLACIAPAMLPPGGARAAGTEFAPAQLKGFPRGQLTVERAHGRDSFRIWIADTPARHEQGLMWLRELPADHGMLFLLGAPRPMNMWMKNTYVPLDMLFFGADGRITAIERSTRPLSTKIIDSGGPVSGVVEIRGGEVERRGIAVGDRILYTADPGPGL